jgi:hypothetical protein
MDRQMVAAATMLTAIGRKMKVLLIFSPLGRSRSARTATPSPSATVATGTMMIHSRLLRRTNRNVESVSRAW